MRVLLSEPRWVDHEVEIPERCPGCSANLTVDGAVECWQWVADRCNVTWHPVDQVGPEVDPSGYVIQYEPSGELQREDIHEEQFQCRECKHQLGKPAPAEGVEPLSEEEVLQVTAESCEAVKRLVQDVAALSTTLRAGGTLKECRELVLDLTDQARQMLAAIEGNAQAVGK